MNGRFRPFFLGSLFSLVLPCVLAPACGGNVVVDPPGAGGSDDPNDPDDPPPCSPGLTPCAGKCVVIASDDANCGSCGNVCNGGFCQAGKCVLEPACPGDLTPCDQVCVDTSSDVFNCGGCGLECPPYWSCVGESCIDPNNGCYCGTICEYIEIGSSVPQSAFVSVASLFNQTKTECGTPGGVDATFVFYPPFTAVYQFHTQGSTVDAYLQVANDGCGFSACTGEGKTGLALELFGGEPVLVTVETLFASGTLQLNVQVVDDECASCAEFLIGENPRWELCSDSAILYDELVNCVCFESCASECQNICSGLPPDGDCQSCVLDDVNGCGQSYAACANDV